MSIIRQYFNDDLPEMIDIIYGSLNKYIDTEHNKKFEKTDDTLLISREYHTKVSRDMLSLTDLVECQFTVYDDSHIRMNTCVLLAGKYKEESLNYLDYTDRGNIKHIYNTIMELRLTNIRKINPSFKW